MASEYIDILLLGKTGMGKSTTGNVLLGLNSDGSMPSGTVEAEDWIESAYSDGDGESVKTKHERSLGPLNSQQLESQSAQPLVFPTPLNADSCGTAVFANDRFTPQSTAGKRKPHNVDQTVECRGPASQYPDRGWSVKPEVLMTLSGEVGESSEKGDQPSTSSVNVCNTTPERTDNKSKPHIQVQGECVTTKPPLLEQKEMSYIKQPQGLPDSEKAAQKPKHFPVGDTEYSMTSVPKVVSCLKSKIRVLDTPGFANSRSSLPVIQANLELIRQIAHLQNKCDFKSHYVLYFLPCRGPPQKADRVLKDEITVMQHYFRKKLWKRVVFVLTAPLEYQDTTMPSLLTKGGPLRKSADGIITAALHDVWKKCKVMGTPEPLNFIYISLDDKPDTIMSQLKSAISTHDDGGLQLRSDECEKCGTTLNLDYDTVITTASSILVKSTTSKCHPDFRRTGLREFFQFNALCIKCNKERGSEGCMPTGAIYKGCVVTHQTLF